MIYPVGRGVEPEKADRENRQETKTLLRKAPGRMGA